jgi:hypothetical protein
MFKVIRDIGISLFVFLVLFEALSAVFFEFGFLPVGYRPLVWAYMEKPQPFAAWRTEYLPWGAWHKENAKAKHKKSCFSLIYSSNEVGARDGTFQNNTGGEYRIIGLGDSFSEGHGVTKADRFDTDIEKSGYDYLNFGAGGNFGPVQYYVLYKNFFSKYKHDAVVILFLPDNDYIDNDPVYWKKNRINYKYRYRPYYRKIDDDNYSIFYPVKRPDGVRTFADLYYIGESKSNMVGKFFRYYTYSFATVKYAIRLIKNKSKGVSSGYYDSSDDQIRSVKYYLEKIIALASTNKKRPVIIFSIPRLGDFMRKAKVGVESPSSKMLRMLAEKHETVHFIDGLLEMPKINPDINNYSLACDGHWSSVGHAIAGKIITRELDRILKSP